MSKIEVIKTVYFVRHGESEDNVRAVFQSFDSSLSEKGKGQALKIADRASRIDFQSLISSTSMRARQTAEAIAQATGKSLEFSDLFVERIKPKSTDGKPHNDPFAKEIWGKWNQSLYTKGLKIEDGENYVEIVDRAKRALEFLENKSEKNILVVTHGFFFRVIVAKVILGDSMTTDNLKNFQSSATMANTGLSVLHYSGWNNEDTPQWRFFVYNDHTHLG
jgi:broad specificity phosphatase PhoE